MRSMAASLLGFAVLTGCGGGGDGTPPPASPPATFALNVISSGPGSVQSAPSGIVCPGDCGESYGGGLQVTLTPQPQPGAAFAGWSGDCAGMGPSCTLTMAAARSVTARFEVQLYALGGSVSGLPAGATGLRLANAGVTIDVPAGSANFTFGAVLTGNGRYEIAIAAQPRGHACRMVDGAGAASSANVTTPRVECIERQAQWAWEGGSRLGGARGVYGTPGVAEEGTVPGGRIEMARWSTPDGNLWIFGGNGIDGQGARGTLADLWRFEPSTRRWIWVSGSRSTMDAGSYGVQGAAAPGNRPPERYNASTWTDASGRLWLFGGQSFDFFTRPRNDLWRFDPATSLWTWVAGSNRSEALPGVPAGRRQARTWRDANGALWLFGGRVTGPDAIASRCESDLWRFDIETSRWTLVRDGQEAATYGTRGVAAAAHHPGGKGDCGPLSTTWGDTAGNLWLMSGTELWRYQPSSGLWTWMSGPKNGEAAAGSLAGTTSEGTPSARVGSSAVGPDGRLWLFGGGDLQDLWVIDPASGAFTRLGGSGQASTQPAFGTAGVPSPDNQPGGRFEAAIHLDASGVLWMFGGSGRSGEPGVGTGLRNDFWRYLPAGH